MLSSISALLVLLLSVAAAVGMSHRWKGYSRVRDAQRRHWISRLICGALGTSIVVALAVSTLRDALRPYRAASTTVFRVPTLPPPVLPAGTRDLGSGRFLMHAVLVSSPTGWMTPLQGETFDVRWPEDVGKNFEFSFASGSSTVTCDVSLSRVERDPSGSEGTLETHGSRSVSVKSFSSHSLTTGGTRFPEVHQARFVPVRGGIFSVLPADRKSAVLLLDLTPVRNEDPLRNGSFHDFLAIRGEDRWRELVASEVDSSEAGQNPGFPAEALAMRLEETLLVLLVAAILFAQLFARRSLGFVKAAAGLLLYVGALDRLAMSVHESRLRDPQATLETRLAACTILPSTTFFREKAERSLEVAANDPATPPAVRDLAHRMLESRKKIDVH